MNVKSPHTDTRTVQLTADGTSGYTHAAGLTKESAAKASELLTINHTLYHTRFNAGFHNHIVHHLLGLWALGARPEEIQDMWEYNTIYQAPFENAERLVSETPDLKDPEVFAKCLGSDDYYSDFMRFFEGEIDAKGVPAVMREYLLNGDSRAEDIFCRMYTDLVHPIIHLGCALEFNQPSLIAEALAAACVHDNWPKKFLLPAEEYNKSNKDVSPKRLLEILDDLRNDPEISTAVKPTDPFNKIRDGLLARVTGEQLAPYLSQFQVEPTTEDLQMKLRDMMHTCAYMMGAAQQPGKRETLDFVVLHSVTLSVFYPAILALDWLTNEEKARLLEAKARCDAVMYAGVGCPEFYPERVKDYVPSHPEQEWPELFHRANIYRDEGHVAKVMRALYSLDQLGDPADGFPLAKADFFKIAHMAVDSTEEVFQPGGHNMPEAVRDGILENVGKGGDMVVNNMTRWVFYGGLEKAWQFVADSKVANGHE
ncbi:hypothetical protein N7462_000631 [Penicillium macrosclerotiorum]|uniref:uncharacterized protein n=1 Tax=Penicillium macrosclerotiorum TaxID=303699 RepID=UPI0025472E2A|nr:uncharacterized protein N7462_000631 [Penicillium macrosclerotiorum]KAJ5698626.1 hypothetical protein N7462_000631 [Penicillium macrosclerotiorum]